MKHSSVSVIIILNFIPIIAVKTDTTEDNDDGYLEFLGEAMREDNKIRRAEQQKHIGHAPKVVPKSFKLPGDYVPLPGRSTNVDYWPLYPLMNQYMAAVTFDTSKGRHTGGDISVPIPDWGFLDIGGHFIERFQDYWAKVGYSNSPINMLGLRKDQIVRILSDPSLSYNRQSQPNLPIAVLPKGYVPQSCKPPLCNPYHSSIGVGVEANVHIEDGHEGEIDLPIPVGKGIGYRLPISGNYHRDTDDISMTYGQNLHPVDPFLIASDQSLFRSKRHADFSKIYSFYPITRHVSPTQRTTPQH
ncbi:hypothetical protein V3C99_008384 [Haemonchus contortus]